MEFKNEEKLVDKNMKDADNITYHDKPEVLINGSDEVNLTTQDNIDELDIETIQISQDKLADTTVEKRSSVVIHEERSQSSVQISAQSLDDLECEPVATVELDSEENNVVLGTSDTDKMNSIRTDTTFDDETPKASTFHMMKQFPPIITKDFAYSKDRPEHLGDYPKLADSDDEMEYDETSDYKKATALYDFEAENPSELSFKEGDLLTIKNQPYDGWFMAELLGESGLIPENYIQLIEEEHS